MPEDDQNMTIIKFNTVFVSDWNL